MKKAWSALLFFLLLSLFSSTASFAQVNIVERFDGRTIQNIITNFGGDAWVVAIGDPGNQTFVDVVNAYSFRWTIRGHAAWMDIGRTMLDNPIEAAQRWGDFFGQISKPVYFEPWNEPSHPEECGNLPLGQCADRIVAFLEALQPYLLANPNIRLMTPAFDTLNANYPPLISALQARNFFTRFPFEAISYHIYGTDNINSHPAQVASWGVAGLPVIITESGAMVSGRVNYTTTELCQFYNQAVPVWQSYTDIQGWALFSFDPTGQFPSWDLWADEAECVRQAIRGEQPDCSTCGQLIGTVGPGLDRASLCPQIPLTGEDRCPVFNNSVDCYYAPNLQQACNLPISPSRFGDTCTYDLRTQVDVNNPQLNCDETGCHEVFNGPQSASLDEDWNQTGVPRFLANLFFSLSKRPESNLPISQNHQVNGFDLAFFRRAIPGDISGARRDIVMLQGVLSHYDDSQGADFIIGCGFVPAGGRIYAAPATSATASCNEAQRPIYTSELACMNETATYKAIDSGMRVQFLPFPDEVNDMCDQLYGADRFATGRISPDSEYGQNHNVAGEMGGMLPHIIANELWERLPLSAASSLKFTATVQGETEAGDLGYGGGLVDSAGHSSDPLEDRGFSAANFFLPQQKLDEFNERIREPVNKCSDRIEQRYVATSTVRIRSFFQIIIDFINRAIDFPSFTDPDGNVAYENSQQIPVSAQAAIDYPGLAPSLDKFNMMYYQILPERVVQDLRAEEDPAIKLRRANSDSDPDQALYMPGKPKAEKAFDAAHQHLWPQRWHNGEFGI